MKNYLFAAAMFVAAPAVLAQVTVNEPWIRGTVPHQTATGAFMRLTAARDTRLVEVKSPVAARVEIHEMKMEDDVMRMRPIEGIDLPAGKPVDLKPGGFHLMFMGLKAPLKEGDTVPVSLVFREEGQAAQTLELAVPVRALTGMSGMSRHGKP